MYRSTICSAVTGPPLNNGVVNSRLELLIPRVKSAILNFIALIGSTLTARIPMKPNASSVSSYSRPYSSGLLVAAKPNLLNVPIEPGNCVSTK